MNNAASTPDARARHWALELTERPSVTGTPDEARFAAWLADRLRASTTFGTAPEIWTFPVAPGDDRAAVAMLLRGRGSRTILLTGHFDTVTTEDYGDLRADAIHPERLLPALRAQLEQSAETPAQRRARTDLAGDAYLPGRGLLDMKAGLAAGLAVAEEFAASEDTVGNILFIAVPDEENASAGARRAARDLGAIARDRDLAIAAAINLDAIADDGDGSQGRAIALGTVGKVLPTAFVAGVASHSGFPFAGVNAGPLMAALAARMEWAPELTDDAPGLPGTPPSMLSLRDGKEGYDVTTPATAFATWNVLTHRRRPAEVLEAFDKLCDEAARAHLGTLADRATRAPLSATHPPAPRELRILHYDALLAAAEDRDPDIAATLAPLRAELAQGDLPLPEQCRRLTERLWTASGLTGPAIVTGFGAIPYLATTLSDTVDARHLARVVREAAAESQVRYDSAITCSPYFAGISDMSFFGEADETSLDIVAQNTPVWGSSIDWPEGGALGMIPTVNIGPWGRDYHTPLERLDVDYAFRVLPRLLSDISRAVLAGPA